MKKKETLVYLLNIILLIAVIMIKYIVNDRYKNYILLATVSFWILLTIYLIYKHGYWKDKNYLKGNTIRIVIISLFSYYLLTYMMGLFTGFSRSVYKLEILTILKNIIGPLIVIVCQEIIRYIYAKKWQYNIKPYMMLTVFYILLNIATEYYGYTFNGSEAIFKFVCLSVFPILARECLCSYLTFKVSYVPTLIIKIAFGISIYILPIFPNLGNYLTSVIGILYPTFIYFMTNKTIMQYDRSNKYVSSARRGLIYIPILVFAVTLIIFTSGIFKYQLIAIGSGSMEPVYKYGDAIVFEKITDLSTIKEGMILAFKKENVIVTHRVIDIAISKDEYIFKTKGDANETPDNFTVTGQNVIGIVVFKIPYIGYPTIWLEEQFK